jgi:hypothetical protein
LSPDPGVSISAGSQTMIRTITPACMRRSTSPIAVWSRAGVVGVHGANVSPSSRCGFNRQPEM